MIKKILFIVFLLLWMPCSVFAEMKERANSLGVGMLISSQAYQGIGTKVMPIPMWSWQYKNFYLRGIEAGSHLIKYPWGHLGVFISPRLMGYKENPSLEMSGMHQRRISADVGLKLTVPMSFLLGTQATVQVTQDVLNIYQGQEMVLMVSRFFKQKKSHFIPQVGIKWQSQALTEYYYGVTNEESRVNRLSYQPHHAINYFAGIRFQVDISKSWSLTSSLMVERLDDTIVHSPIIERRAVISSMMGIVKKF